MNKEPETLVESEAVQIAQAVMVWGAPHFKHIVSFNVLVEAIENVLATLSSKGRGEAEASDAERRKIASLGMKPWPGGDGPPSDWDGGDVLRRESNVRQSFSVRGAGHVDWWKRHNAHGGARHLSDIIAYTAMSEARELDRSPAQFFYEVGYGACWAEALIRNDSRPPFPLTDAIVERGWRIAGEAHDDPDEFERYLAAANGSAQTPPALSGGGELREAQIDAAARALYKDYEETTDEHVAWVFDYANEPDDEARAHWEGTVRDMREWATKALDAALAQSTPAVGEGWRLVPVTPTVDMIAAWYRQKNRGTQDVEAEIDPNAMSDYDAYRAMLAALPLPVVPHGGEL